MRPPGSPSLAPLGALALVCPTRAPDDDMVGTVKFE